MTSQMSYFNYTGQRHNFEENIEDYMKRKNEERTSQQNSPDRSEISGKHPSQKPSPLRNTNLSPVRPGIEESAFYSQNIFQNSPKPTLTTERGTDSAEKRSGGSLDDENNENVSPNNNMADQGIFFKTPNRIGDFIYGAPRKVDMDTNSVKPFNSGSNVKDGESNLPRMTPNKDLQTSATKQSAKTNTDTELGNNVYSVKVTKPQTNESMNDSILSDKGLLPLARNSNLDYQKPPLGQSYLNPNKKLNSSHLNYSAAHNDIHNESLNSSMISRQSGVGRIDNDKVAQSKNRSRLSSQGSEKQFENILSARTLDNIVSNGIIPNTFDFTQDVSAEIVKYLKKKREKYIDNIYLPLFSSLVNSTKKHKKKEWNVIEWKRVSEIYRGSKITLYEDISPLHLVPGLLKNYGVLSAIAALAEVPSTIMNLIPNQAYNDEGCYSVRICKDGVWKYSLVDDFIPSVKDKLGFSPAFLRSQLKTNKKVDIWPVILEKAWAKTFHTYENIEEIDTFQMLRDLTGAPCYKFNVDEATIWDYLYETLSEGNIVVARCKVEGLNERTPYKRGLNPLFDKAVLEALTVKTSKGEVRLIKIRNLWGEEFEWDGEWGYNSDKWTPQIKEELKYDTSIAEKVLFLTPEEFGSFSSEGFVCSYNKNASYNCITLRHIKNAHSVVKFKVEKPAECFFEVTQLDEHYYRRHPEYKYAVSRLIIAKQEANSDFTYLMGKVANSKYNNAQLTLTEGVYYAFVMVDWTTKVYDINLSVYSEESIEFERMPYNENSGILTNVFRQYISQCVPPILVDNDESQKKYQLDFDELSLTAEVYTNESANKKLTLKKKLIQLENCSLLNQKSQGDNLELSVSPGSSQLVLFGKKELEVSEFSFQSEEKALTK